MKKPTIKTGRIPKNLSLEQKIKYAKERNSLIILSINDDDLSDEHGNVYNVDRIDLQYLLEVFNHNLKIVNEEVETLKQFESDREIKQNLPVSFFKKTK